MANGIRILVDADSCPAKQRSIILRSCIKNGLETVFAADRPIKDVLAAIADNTYELRQKYLQTNPGADEQQVKNVKSAMKMVTVETGENSADDYLVTLADENCLCVTRDILLTKRLLEKGARCITDRGKTYTLSDINARLSEKNANAAFREAGLFEAEQTKPLSDKDLHTFSCAWDALLQKMLRK